MRIVITGATGFIGRNLVNSLRLEHELYILVRTTTDYTFLHVDHVITFNDDIDNLTEIFRKERIDGIIHLASLYTAEHKSGQIKELILSNIYLGTVLLEACKDAGVKWFLNTGTIWQNYIAESPEYCPVNLYAATKQSFVDIAKYYTETSPLRFCTLKLCDTYGLGDTRRKILSLFKDIGESGEKLEMSPGEQKIDLIYIDDVITGFKFLMSKLAFSEKLETEYVLTSGNPIRLKDLAALYEKISHKKLNIHWGGRAYRVREVMKPWRKGNILMTFKLDEEVLRRYILGENDIS